MKTSIGEKIRNLREDADLTQAQLGANLHMTQRKISYIECGMNEPGIDDLKAFCRYFKISANYLLDLPEKYEKD